MSTIYETDVAKKLLFYKMSSSPTNITSYVVAGSFTLERSISETQLNFGEANPTRIQFETTEDLSLTGYYIRVTYGNSSDGYEMLGYFKVSYSSHNSGTGRVNCIAYDGLKDFDVDVADWYAELSFPMTLSNFRASLASYIGISVVSATLVNDDLELEQTIDADSLNGLDVLYYIGQLNGAWPVITTTSSGYKLSWLALASENYEIPATITYGPDAFDRKSYETAAIGAVQIREEDGDVGATVGTGTEKYVVQGNPLCYGMDSDWLTEAATNLYGQIGGVSYTPCSIRIKWQPTDVLPMGAAIVYGDYAFYLLKSTVTNAGMLSDTIEAPGNEYLEENSIENSIIQLKGKSNVITKSVEENTALITDVEANLSNEISQTAESLTVQIEQLQSEMDGTVNIYYATETPTLLNYPAWDFSKTIPCNGTVSPADDLTLEYNSTYYASWLRCLAYDIYEKTTYRFLKKNSTFYWDTVSDSEFTAVLEKVNTLEMTVDGLTETISAMTVTLADDYYTISETEAAISTSATNVMSQVAATYVTTSTLNSNYYTKSSVNSLISQSATSILTQVASEYVSVDNDYITTSDCESLIEQSADSILSSVAGTYVTTSTLNSNYYTKSSVNSLISQSATSIMAQVENEYVSVDNDYITTSDCESLIEQSAESIAASVAGTYETKTNAESTKTSLEASLELKLNTEDLVSEINASADVITLTSNRISITSSNFTLTKAGVITATSGTIGGFTIGSSTIRAGSSSGQYFRLMVPSSSTTVALAIGATSSSSYTTAPFYVRANGAVTCSDLTATGGTIGGFTIGSSTIKGGSSSGQYLRLMVPSSSTMIALSIGATSTDDYSTAPFYVRANGTLVATSATITGSITATSGTIGGNTISSTGIYYGSHNNYGSTSSGFWLGYSGLSIGSTFRVTAAGALIATNATVSGTVTASALNAVSDDSSSTSQVKVTNSAGTLSTIIYGGSVTSKYFYAGQLTVGNGVTSTTTDASGTAIKYTYTLSGQTYIKYASFSSSSDIKLKDNVKAAEVDSALDVLEKIVLHSFDWKLDGEHQKIGFIADELEQIDEHFVVAGTGQTLEDGSYVPKAIDTFYLLGYIVKAIKELKERTE